MSLTEKSVFDAPPPTPKKRRKSPEGRVVRECLLWLKQHGVLAVRTHAGYLRLANGNWMHAGAPGWPDITGCLPDGQFLGVECKAAKGRQSEGQARIEREITERGGLYVVARSTQDIAEHLARHGQLRPDRR